MSRICPHIAASRGEGTAVVQLSHIACERHYVAASALVDMTYGRQRW
jgi:hypothetical protein